jgi:hypothetical protein
MNVGGFLYYRNQKARAQWMYRWAQQGGSFFHPARPLMDLRNADDLRRYRLVEGKRRFLKHGRKVVSFAAWKFRNVRKAATRQRVGEARA